MLVSRVLVDGRSWLGGIAAADLLTVPDEVLQEVALILGQEQHLRLIDHISEIGDQLLALGRKIL